MRRLWIILRSGPYRRYFFGAIVSSVGNGMYFIGISWLLLQLTGTTSSMGWLLASTSLPGIFLSPWIGVLVDRLDRRWTCAACDLFRGATLLLIPFLYYAHSLPVWRIYTIVFFVAIGDRFYWPASGGLIREIVPVSELLPANSLSSICTQTGVLVGAGVAGLLIVHFGPVFVILLNACSFFISAVATLLIRGGWQPPARDRKDQFAFFLDISEGARYLREHQYVIGIAVLQVILYVALYTTNVLLPMFSARVLNVGARGFGMIDACWAAGAIVGGISLVGITGRIGERRYVWLGLLSLACAIALFVTSRSLTQAMLGYLFMGLFFVTTRITYDTIIQSEVATEFQGRVKSAISMGIAFVSFTTYIGVGWLGDVLPLRVIYAALAVLIFLGGLLAIPISRIKASAVFAPSDVMKRPRPPKNELMSEEPTHNMEEGTAMQSIGFDIHKQYTFHLPCDR